TPASPTRTLRSPAPTSSWDRSGRRRPRSHEDWNSTRGTPRRSGCSRVSATDKNREAGTFAPASAANSCALTPVQGYRSTASLSLVDDLPAKLAAGVPRRVDVGVRYESPHRRVQVVVGHRRRTFHRCGAAGVCPRARHTSPRGRGACLVTGGHAPAAQRHAHLTASYSGGGGPARGRPGVDMR